jgi:amino acid adenylation domain-containing protein/non-ribosomal peptide synthase protein (TIGR01720 family)
MPEEKEKYKEAMKKAINKINLLNQKIEELSQKEEIAIIGYSCRFPGGANNAEKFWELLVEGYDAVTEIPKERFPFEEYFNSEKGVKGKTYTKQASFLKYNIKEFDYAHFEMNETEAASLDPQHRLLFEVIWEALQNSGLYISKIKGSKTGVFIGMDSSEYAMAEILSDSPDKITPYSLMGNSVHASAGRVAYYYDFKGPTIVYNTGCSSALAALEAAVQSLRTKQCDMAIVGGVNLLLTPNGFIGLSQINALAQDGRCKAFDQSADGYGRGEGCGVIILKRFEEAKADHNHVEAIVKSISIQQDGRSNGFFAPNGISEYQVIKNALEASGLTSDDIDYVETHGTGTVLGDTIEGQALSKVFSEKKTPLLIGSVKTNIGHLEAASGMASLIKVLLSMKYGKIPASIHFHNPNKNFDYSKVKVVEKLTPWNKESGRRSAGISSFGISGALIHVVLQEAPKERKIIQPQEQNDKVLTLSATTDRMLQESIKELRTYLYESKNSIEDIIYTSNLTRSTLPYRFALSISDRRDLEVLLDNMIESEDLSKKYCGFVKKPRKNVICILPGFCALNQKKILSLVKSYSVFAEIYHRCERRFQELLGISVTEQISLGEQSLPCLFTIQSAMAELWKSIGIIPLQFIGSGGGSYAASYLSGREAFDVITARAAADDMAKALPKADITDLSEAEAILILGYDEATEKLQNKWVNNATYITLFGHETNHSDDFACGIQKLYCNGFDIQWDAFYNFVQQPLITLPNYPFQKKKCWREVICFRGLGGGKTEDEKVSIAAEQTQKSISNVLDTIKGMVSEISGIVLEDIEADQELFSYGFDSFSFIALSNLIKKSFGVAIPIEDFFTESNTLGKITTRIEQEVKPIEIVSEPEDLCLCSTAEVPTGDLILDELYQQRELLHQILAAMKKGQAEDIFNAMDEDKFYPMSTIQERLYSQLKMVDEDPFDLVGTYYVNSDLNIARLEQYVKEIVSRHKILTVSMFLKEGEFVQQKNISKEIKVRTLYQNSDMSLDAFISDSLCTFRLDEPPLVEVLLIHTTDNRKLLVFHFHHTVADGYSMNLFAKELMQLYSGDELPKLDKQYFDFAKWEKNYCNTKEYVKEEKFWLEHMNNAACVLPLPYDYPKTQHTDYHGDAVVRTFSADTISKLRKICSKYHITLFMAFYSVVNILLHKMTGENNLAMAVPVSCRDKGGFNNNIGMFTNTLAFHVGIDSAQSYEELLQHVKEFCLKAYANVNYPFHELAHKLGLTMQNSLNVVYVYENINSRVCHFGPLELEQYPFTPKKEEFELTFEMFEHDNIVDAYLRYQTALFQRETVELIGERLERIIDEICNNPAIRISDIDMLTDRERELILDRFNATALTYPHDKTFVDLFEEQVVKTPEHIAIKYDNRNITYEELNKKANCLAHKLRDCGVMANDIVAILSIRSVEMIAAMIGIMKAGGAYVPIDPSYPEDRIQFMLKDCNPKAVVLYQTEVKTSAYVINMEDEEIWNKSLENPLHISSPEDMAYCIYTSGTTGKPKGVMLCHRGITSMNAYLRKLYQIDEEDRVLQFANYVFDASVWEITMSLLNGACLVLISSDVIADIYKFNKYIKDMGITITLLPPQYYLQTDISGLKVLTTGGSASNADIVRKARNNHRYINAYGPTENTVLATHWEYTKEIPGTVPIGKPINNTQIYIMNGDKLCGIGIPGELCIAGPGLAKGYLNQEQLTKEKFTKNPFGEGQLYHTGDLVRWIQDGNIIYLGRIDEQVKIRGFRIELGEIESTIRNINGLKECTVLAKEDSFGDHILAAYIVSDQLLDIPQIRDRLGQILPPYMIPAYFLQIDHLPVNQSGKIDKKALPDIAITGSRDYVAPCNELERTLCQFYEKILNVDKVGIRDSFFELGGHSLRATRLVNLIAEQTGYQIVQKDIFANPTVEKLAEKLIQIKDQSYEHIPKAEEKEFYPMSSPQKRIFIICEMDKEGILYNMPQCLKLSGDVKPDRIEYALREMIKRHEILRTEFVMADGEPVQKIRQTEIIDFEYVENVVDTEETLMDQFIRPFDLSCAPLLRLKLVKREDSYNMLLDMHHIIGDGMSMINFIDEFSALYNGMTLMSPMLQYKDYSEWVRARKLAEQRDYWLQEFADEIPVLDIPLDYIRPKVQSYHGAVAEIELEGVLGVKIRKMAKETGTTEYMLLLSSLMTLLSKYSRQEDIVIGCPISGRIHKDTEKMLGIFANTLALRGKPCKEKRFFDFLNEVKKTCLNAYENQEYPFEELVDALDVRRDIARNPLFDVMLVLQNNEVIQMPLQDVEISVVGTKVTIARFDLVFNVWEDSSSFHIGLEYCADLFKEETIRRILQHYVTILEQITEDADLTIADIAILTEHEQKIILDEFNRTESPYKKELTIIDLFEEQVQAVPDKAALIFDDRQMTYTELNQQANQLAHVLRETGVGPEDCVAILAERSFEMLIGIYGIIKAGGVYVPIDLEYPKERIQYILEDCKAKAVVLYRAEIDTKVPIIDLEDRNNWANRIENPDHMSKASDLAYIIYTSGTTGNPKGVMIEHRGVVNLKYYFEKEFGINCEDRILQFANYVFDASVWEMAMALLNGATLVLIPKSMSQNSYELEKYCLHHQVTVATLPPNYYLLTENFKPRILITAGSAANRMIVEKAKNSLYINAYGPTENTVCATHWAYDGIENIPEYIPIGKPITNVRVYILDQEKLCGIGVPGELCIAGDGVARGYLNLPELTKERFIDDPFGDGKLYRTGDLAYWASDGSIIYLGRIDEQVKIRGYRVELGEIESTLRKIAFVQDCAVLVRKDAGGEGALHAYFVSETAKDADDIKEILGRSLPEYMLPTYIKQIASIPVTRSGKLDKKALPDIEMKNNAEYVKPGNELEMMICNVFEEVLGVDKVGLKDNFFSLGGDSIKAIRIVTRMRENGYQITTKDIMSNYIVENILPYVIRSMGNQYEQGEVTGTVIKTPMIRDFFQWNLRVPSHFNQSIMLRYDEDCEQELHLAFKYLVEYHDMLRVVCSEEQLNIRPYDGKNMLDFQTFYYDELDITHPSITETCTILQSHIDLRHGPIIRCGYFILASGYYLMVCIHHLAIDGISWQILLNDLDLCLKQLKSGKDLKLPAKTASFQDWALYIKAYKESRKCKAQKPYWEGVAAKINQGNIEAEKACIGRGYEEIDIGFTKEETKCLLSEVNQAYNTETTEILMSALSMAVYQWTRQTSVSVYLESHGRYELDKHMDVDRTIGWFTSCYPVVFDYNPEESGLIIQTKEKLREVPDHGMSFGILKDSLKENQLPSISFNYFGQIYAQKGFESDLMKYTGRNFAEENEFMTDIAYTGRIENSELHIICNFNLEKHSLARLKELSELLRCNLIKIMEHCGNVKAPVITKSDITVSHDIGTEEYDEIMNMFH